MKRYLIVLSLILLASCGHTVESELPYGDKIESFEAVNQHGDTFTEDSLDGKVWLMNFIFTNCPSVCPPMSLNMTEVTQKLDAGNIEDYGIISFSVDPNRDTSEALDTYISGFEVPDDVDWNLLTGYTPEFISEFARENFYMHVATETDESGDIAHGILTYLVDKDGTIMKAYPGITVSEDRTFDPELMVKDVEYLSKR